jgi:hypothetical protein
VDGRVEVRDVSEDIVAFIETAGAGACRSTTPA